MSKSNPFIIGRGTKLNVALLRKGSRTLIPSQIINLGNTAAASGATTLTVTALDEPILASPDSPAYLSFSDAVDGGDRFVEVTANALAGAISLTIAPLKKPIAAASSAEYPVRLQARTNANVTPSIENIDTTTFDTGGYKDGIVPKIGYEISCDGNFLPLDAGYRTCIHAVNNFHEVFLKLTMAPPEEGYTHGYIYEGVAAVTALPLQIGADAIITANMTFALRGEPKITAPA